MNIPRRSFLLLAIPVALLSLLCAPHALAVWQSDPSQSTPFLSGATAVPRQFEMKPDGAGGSISVWTDDRASSPSTGTDIYAQRLDAQGNRLWADAGAPVAVVAGTQHRVNAVPDGNGGAFFAWLDERPNSGGSTKRIFAQHLDAAGAPLWAANGIEVDASSSDFFLHYLVSMCPDGVGGIYLFVPNTNPNGYRLHRVGADGVRPAGWETPVALTLGSSFWATAVLPKAAAGASGPFDVWVVGFYQGAGSIVVNSVTASRVIGTAVTLTHSFLNFPPPVVDDQGGLWLASGSNFSVYINRFRPDGTPAWPDSAAKIFDGAAISPAVGSLTSSIVPASGGSAIIVWNRNDSSRVSLLGQKYSATGQPLWTTGGVELLGGTGANAPAPYVGSAIGASAISDGADGVIALAGYSPALFRTQRANASGALLWPAAGVVVSNATTHFGALASDAANGAFYGLYRTVSSGVLTFGAQHVSLSGALGSNSPSARLANISARAQVGSGSGVLIPGFVVSGGPVQLLVRGIGPTLADFNVAGVLADPQLTLFNSANAAVATNDDWSLASNAALISSVGAQVFAFPLASGSKDAAMLVTLQPGLYTAVMSGKNSGAGVGLVEIYETDNGVGGGRLANMSVRAQVGTGDNILIPGIVVGGSAARTLLIRAVGPTLTGFGVTGVLADPQITLYNSAGTAVGTNDNWSSSNATAISAAAAQVSAFPLASGSKDAVLLVTLGTGTYTAQISGVGNTSGVCLVEVYEVP